MSSKAKIVMAGCHETGYNLIKDLLAEGVCFDHFVTISAEKAEKAKVSGYADFGGLAAEYNIPIYYAHSYSLKNEKDQQFFQEHGFDLLIQGGWQRLFPDTVLNTLRLGAIGLHGSSEFLPKGRGRSPINWSIIEGKKRFILHFFLIKAGIDDGDVFHAEMFDINEWDTCRTLYYKNSVITRKVLLDYIPRLISGDYKVIPQDGEPTYYPKRTAEDGRIHWEKNTVFQIHNLIRAVTKPYPGAFTNLGDEKITIWAGQPFDTRISYPNALEGEVVEEFSSGDIVVNCNSGGLLITEYEATVHLKKGDILK